jgi:hypothetical protein
MVNRKRLKAMTPEEQKIFRKSGTHGLEEWKKSRQSDAMTQRATSKGKGKEKELVTFEVDDQAESSQRRGSRIPARSRKRKQDEMVTS